MKVTIKTNLITLKIEDEITISENGFTKRSLPELEISIKLIINEAIKLHNEIIK